MAEVANADAEAVDFNLDDDDLMDEEYAEPAPAPAPRLRSAIAGGGDGARRTKGRGFRDDPNSSAAPRDSSFAAGGLDSGGGSDPVRSIEGWIVLATGIHEEAQEDDLHNIFRDYGEVKNLHLNLDRRTGFVKGYALVEYENFKEAQAAIKALDGSDLIDRKISVDWAFSNGPVKHRNTRKRSPRAHRSRSPPRRRH